MFFQVIMELFDDNNRSPFSNYVTLFSEQILTLATFYFGSDSTKIARLFSKIQHSIDRRYAKNLFNEPHFIQQSVTVPKKIKVQKILKIFMKIIM